MDEVSLLSLMNPVLKIVFSEHVEDLETKALKRHYKEMRTRTMSKWDTIIADTQSINKKIVNIFNKLLTKIRNIFKQYDYAQSLKSNGYFLSVLT